MVVEFTERSRSYRVLTIANWPGDEATSSIDPQEREIKVERSAHVHDSSQDLLVQHSLVSRPLPAFQCCRQKKELSACNIENLGVAWGRGYARLVDPDWSHAHTTLTTNHNSHVETFSLDKRSQKSMMIQIINENKIWNIEHVKRRLCD